VLRTQPFFMQLVAGMEQTLSEHGVSLQLALATDQDTEMATYRRWWAERRVDGVLLTDLRVSDPRPPLLHSLGAPAVLFGAPGRISGTPVLRTDERHDVDKAVEHLTALGHRTIGHVQGPADLQHTRRRSTALREAVRNRIGTDVVQAEGSYTEQGGISATRRVLAAKPRPTAIIYDNDVMAVAVVASAAELGVRVPADLAVLAWDDSMLCRVVQPAVTAFAHDIAADAATAAHLLLELIETGVADDAKLSERELVPRGSTMG
jgi:DNA-binding LacI/PurR family transcriptional regulator